MNIAQPLSELIESQKISRSKLARSIGVHTSTVSNWLDGKDVKPDNLSALCAYFNRSPSYFMGWSDVQKSFNDLGLSIEDVAFELDLSRETIERILNSGDSGAIEKIVKAADVLIKNKKPAPVSESELDNKLIKMLVGLSPDEIKQVDAFVQGLIAARKA